MSRIVVEIEQEDKKIFKIWCIKNNTTMTDAIKDFIKTCICKDF